MPDIEIEETEGVRLTHALLVYKGYQEVVITKHDVEHGVIQPGAPLDTAAFIKLIEGGKTSQSGWSMQFPRLLGESPKHLAWWSRPQVQRVFIGNEDKKVKVREAWVPGLVWIAVRGQPSCLLRAFDGDDPPTMTTDMYHPRFGPEDMNHVHNNGSICVGTMKLTDLTPSDWERAFWSSRFKTAGNLKTNKPYACKKAFKKVGTLASILPRGEAAD